MFKLTNRHNKLLILLVLFCNYVLHVRPTGLLMFILEFSQNCTQLIYYEIR